MSGQSKSPRTRRTSKYGWRPDIPDARDHLYSAPQIALAALPPSVDLVSGCPPVYDQGRIGSCTANAIAAAFEFDLIKQQLPDFRPSRLFIYYNERAIEGSVQYDSGAQIRDGMKTVAKLGVCPEEEWAYDDTPPPSEDAPFPDGARDGQRPSDQCYQDATAHRATTYRRVLRDLDQMRGCLAAGYPFVFGFTVYDSFESEKVSKTGVVPMPQPDEQVLGGHAVLAVGYDDSTQAFTVRNSWGEGWGRSGYFLMPYPYLTTRGLASDFWTMRVVT